MAGEFDNGEQRKRHTAFSANEKAVLCQVAKILVCEEFISPEEQLRFLYFLKGEV